MKAIQALLPMKDLRSGVSQEYVLSSILWIAQGLMDKYVSTFPENVENSYDAYYQKLSEEMDEYFNIIKYSIYEGDSVSESTKVIEEGKSCHS